jgi:hypothetical protein
MIKLLWWRSFVVLCGTVWECEQVAVVEEFCGTQHLNLSSLLEAGIGFYCLHRAHQGLAKTVYLYTLYMTVCMYGDFSAQKYREYTVYTLYT